MSLARAYLDDLAAFVTAAPSSFHAAREGGRRLAEAGFSEHDESHSFEASPGGHYLVRDGTLLAWSLPDSATPTTGFRVVGSHTDSPTLKLKPRPDVGAYGWQQVGMEIYGGPLLNSWLDRELGLAGRLVLADGTDTLVRSEAIMRIPQLAVHLDRGVNDNGLTLDKQQHLVPVWSVGQPELRVMEHLAQLAGCQAEDILGCDVVAFATEPPAVFGPAEEFFASPRLDNLSSVHASLVAMEAHTDGDSIAVLAAFDHEEVGSGSRSGAAGPVLADTIELISDSLGASGPERGRALSQSFCLSADTGHAVHPNYPNKHDSANRPLLNGGPLLKLNANQRYATDARGAAIWRRACREVDVDVQEFVSNNAVPCGSTIGPLTATRIGMTTIDVGIPLLSMHSARELAGTADPASLARAIGAFFRL